MDYKYQVGDRIYVTRCYNCGVKRWYPLKKIDFLREGVLCPKCRKKFKKLGIPKLKDSDYRPDKFNFIGGKDSSYAHIGVELEIDVLLHNTLEVLKVIEPYRKYKNKQLFWCSHEPSVPNGFEIIFHPMNWSFLESNLVIKNIMDSLGDIEIGTGSLYNCGLHFHIDRKYFGKTLKEQDKKIYKFIYIFDKFQKELIEASGRDSFDIRNFCQFFGRIEKDRRNSEILLREYNYGKITSVNLSNDDTIEVRLFSGTISYSTFKKYLRILYACMTSSHHFSKKELYNIDNFDTILSRWS